MFKALHELRDAIESTYGGALSFEPLATRKACRIADHRAGEITDPAAWPDYLDWFVDSQQRLRSAISAVGGIPKPSR